MSANIQGLCPSRGKYKIKMIGETATHYGTSIIALTESHLNSSFHEGEVSIEGFDHYRSDRKEGVRKGGVVVYIHTNLSAGTTVLCSDSIGSIEIIIVNIPAANLVMVCIYRPPGAIKEQFIEVMTKIKDCLSQANLSSSVYSLCGDLNFPIIDWQNCTIQGGTVSTQQQARALLDLFEDHFLHQYITEGTRGANILDLFAANDDQLICRVEILSKSKISDHNIVIVETTQYLKPETENPEKEFSLFSLNFWDRNINWEQINERFSTYSWETLFNDQHPDLIYQNLCAIIKRVAYVHIVIAC